MRDRKRESRSIWFEGPIASWEEAKLVSVGYDSKIILDRTLGSTLKVRDGSVAFERDSVQFSKIEYSWPLLSGVLLGLAERAGPLSVLDFGGSLGTTYFQIRRFLREIDAVDWAIVEQHHYVEAGIQHLETPHFRFFRTIEEAIRWRRPAVALFSSVLQYLEHPSALLEEIVRAEPRVVILDRTPMTDSAKNQPIVQHIPAHIYEGSIPMWLLSRGQIASALQNSYNLVEEFDALGGTGRTNDGVTFSWVGQVWARKSGKPLGKVA